MAEIDIRHVAKLARIAISDAEAELFGAQLGALLEHVVVLEGLPVADVAATAQVIPAHNVFRDDEPAPCLARATVLDGAPSREGVYFRVPRIIAEEP